MNYSKGGGKLGKRKITFDYSNALDFIDKKELYSYKEKVALCHRKIHVKTSETSELLGWVDVENYYKSEECELPTTLKGSGFKV